MFPPCRAFAARRAKFQLLESLTDLVKKWSQDEETRLTQLLYHRTARKSSAISEYLPYRGSNLGFQFVESA
jgi:hypothetical protein